MPENKNTEDNAVQIIDTQEVNSLTAGIPSERAKHLKETFVPIMELLEGFEERYNDIIGVTDIYTPQHAEKARKLRLEYRKVRVSADHAHKELKKDINLQAKAIDGMRNIIKYASSDKEEQLSQIENYVENQRKLEIAAKQEDREEALREYGYDQFPPNLGEMKDDEWEIYFIGARESYRRKKEAEEKAALIRDRREKILPYRIFVKDFDSLDLGEIKDKEFNSILESAKQDMQKQEEEKRKLEEERARLQKEKHEREVEEKKRLEEAIRKEREEAERKAKLIQERVSGLKYTSYNGEGITCSHTGKLVSTRDKLLKMSEDRYGKFSEKHNASAEKRQEEIDRKEEERKERERKEKEILERQAEQVRREMEELRKPKVSDSASDIEKLKSLIKEFREFEIPNFKTDAGKDAAKRTRGYLEALCDKLNGIKESM